MLIRRTPLIHTRLAKRNHRYIHHQPSRQAAVAAAITPAPTPDQIHEQALPIQRYDPAVPPSYKPPDLRKSQLLRQYASLIRSTPLTIFFQHNSLKASEWTAIRRELSEALHKTSATQTPNGPDPADSIRLQVIHTGMYAVALRVAEFYTPPDLPSSSSAEHQQDATQQIHAFDQHTTIPTHALSAEAHEATLDPSALAFRAERKDPTKFSINPRAHRKRNTPIHSLLRGPIAALAFPTVTPAHLATALSILSPTPGASSAFPAPRRAANPRYYDPAVQGGLQKLILLGARVEGRALDPDGVRFVGGLASQGGIEGLRAQLVGLLQRVGGSVTSTLESASRSLWVTMESRRLDLDSEGKNGNEATATGSDSKSGE